ncbi:forespore capture DNA-binding protein RefZ [Virgibacillus sp. 179-BFC.A HS]|uniref:Forespore capture DNA-binding protein RefZ n=1 Tax=Tigheibacillus jepli TaxID=3035914 RepID=A0ABU5CG84_9BACI|nr:forespore capture DNA-binding protein RefZ [Virgibacillus sp. 179-BFC.A HS]MDY0405324.1 forespore capture DNA-binding protein RefZ [Virgibacillus sp. 179-BFC.A HS]
MQNQTTKEKIIDAASGLFFQKGFSGTSVRDIADKASVNVSAISYHFKGKQGLLEYAITHYYEAYFIVLEETLEKYRDLPAIDRLKKLISAIIHYKQENHQFSYFIHRELSFDSTFVREVVVTYLAKENHVLSEMFFAAVDHEKYHYNKKHFLLMQLKGMLMTPFAFHSEMQMQTIGSYSTENFVKHYTEVVWDWLDFCIGKA